MPAMVPASYLKTPLRHYPETRLRRLRRHSFLRRLVRESNLCVDDLIYPVFVLPGTKQRQPVSAMPGIERLSVDLLVSGLEDLLRLGIPAIALFPVVPDECRSPGGEAAWDEQGLVQQAIRACKSALPELGIITDVALDPYTTHGHDGLVDESGQVLNDQTVAALVRQGLSQAQAGSDVLAPSDMMDGRVAALRAALERQGFHDTVILSYAAKYASAFYGPFRSAVGSGARLGRADKSGYQMDPANSAEALHEVALDIQEGADMVMVKPGLPYLDILWRVKERYAVPLCAYQVSGEYALLKAAAGQEQLDERALVLESVLALRRAGADAIFSYYAPQLARWLQEDPPGG